ncbi:ABC transporter permease [Rhodococcus sp. X156]|uniref:ABC transporter permease n=1 Tax=Rhodococcus sp. X156 TaxID=2499145 RepID=UPI001F4960FD|nr:ABC transporter permease [Rhodococcus sp. X156]
MTLPSPVAVATGSTPVATRPSRDRLWLVLGTVAVVVLAGVSLFIGVSDVRPSTLWEGGSEAWEVLVISRVPRTLALVLAGASMAIAGLIMQMLARNKFVEPSTAGTVESATLGILVMTMLAPGLPVLAKMLGGAVFALIGTALFLRILRRLPTANTLLVPLVGLMLGGVIGAVCDFFAYRADLLQSLSAWTTGDFSAVIQGRYEMLWLAGLLAVIAYAVANRFTVAGLGETFTTNLGLNYRRVLTLGLSIVALVTAVVVVTVGAIPFLGLIVPNVVSMIVGDNARRGIPWVAVGGAGFVLACDIVARTVRYPFEMPIGTVVGVIGAAVFLFLLLRGTRRGPA